MKNEIEIKVNIPDNVREVIAELIYWAATNGLGTERGSELLTKLYSGSETSVN